jgi:hypothetical protein
MRRHIPLILLVVCVGVLIFGILRLFTLRFEVGDVYPSYSSLRSDPLGSMALYESLAQIPGVSTQRNLSTSHAMPTGAGSTYFLLAVPMSALGEMPAASLDALDRFVAEGGRLVITLLPDVADGRTPPATSQDSARQNRRVEMASTRDRWGVDSRVVDLDRNPDSIAQAATVINAATLPVPESLEWHSGIVFGSLSESWMPIYSRGSDPVLIERSFGNGTIVLASDSYFVSNEAMLNDRHADLLSWIVGSPRSVVFDEAHFGIVEEPGVATLIRRYRLHGVVAGLILLAALFVWKSAYSLTPHTEEAKEQHIKGKDAAAGFDNLLRRSIPGDQLLSTCFTEWRKSVSNSGTYSAQRIDQAEAALNHRDPVEAYQTIYRILQKKTK